MNYSDRVDKFSLGLQKKNIDAAVLFSYPNIRYFTGVRVNEAIDTILIVTNEGEATYLVPMLDYTRVKKTCWIDNVLPFPEDNPNYLAPLADAFDNKNIRIVGIEEDAITFYKMNFLKEISQARLVPIDDLVIGIRAIKTKEEIAFIREAARIADKAMQESLGLLKEGIAEAEISSYASYIMEREGAEGTAFEPFVMSGENAWLPQRFSSNKKIGIGEMIIFDMGAKYEGYCSDLTRTFSLGGLNKQQKEIFRIAYSAQREALNAVRPEIPAGEIDKIAREFISRHGYGEYFPHITGHGVGISIHEKPILDKGSETILEPNMVVTIEPGIYLKGVGAARVEDMVLVTEDGHEVLTSTERMLI